jgi:iron only hydrogenase large subunit-like protein
MQTFKQLYESTLKSVLENDSEGVGGSTEPYNPYHLDCLLNPKKHPLVIHTDQCDCAKEHQAECMDRCPFGAISLKGGDIAIDSELCVGCAACIDGCASEKLTATTDIIPALKAVRSSKGLVYAMIAPAFLGQFSEAVTPGKLRTAFKQAGFDGMIEVALFADILTLKEALEFDKNINDENAYQLTSCCCPMWIAMIKKIYNQLMPHVPGSVSPMVACARVIKALHPDALTVFIGPCLAKKAEAREKDLVGDVDFVLTFQEVQNIFDALGIHPEELEESEKDHSSKAGRIYARKGGVSEAVANTVKVINPDREIDIRTKQADGVPACKQMIQDILDGKADANFYEGMGCVGGCVGGPRSVVGIE